MKVLLIVTLLFFIVAASFGQTFQKLDSVLLKTFPENSSIDGKWVYYSANGHIKKIDKPEVSKVLPNYTFYQVDMTNFLGYHVYTSTCLILFDSNRLQALLAVPMWYNDISKDFLKLFIGKKFNDTVALMNFMKELQDLMFIGSRAKIEDPKLDTGKVTFDMKNNYSKGKEIWRHIEISIIDNTIRRFKSTNPMMNESIIVQ